VPAGPDPVRECRHSSAVSTYDHDRNRGDLGGHLPRRPVLGAAAPTLNAATALVGGLFCPPNRSAVEPWSSVPRPWQQAFAETCERPSVMRSHESAMVYSIAPFPDSSP
jgi:hypothetical protein